MNRKNWIGIICLSLLLIGGLAVEVNAQQPAAPPAPAESTQAPESPARPAPQGDSSAQPAQPPPPPPSTNTQIETRTETERVVVEQPGTFLGVNATMAMIIGAVLVIVVVIGLVAMSRRGDDVHHTHTRHQV